MLRGHNLSLFVSSNTRPKTPQNQKVDRPNFEDLIYYIRAALDLYKRYSLKEQGYNVNILEKLNR